MRKSSWSVRAVIGCVAALAMSTVPGGRADSVAIDFEGYSTGTVNMQDGWSSFGAAGGGCAVYDHAIVDNTGAVYEYASFGTRSLRMSNAVVSGCFGDQTFSKPLADEAGETTAFNDDPDANPPLSGGVRQRRFVAQWDFASTVPDAEQPGLSTVASADRGDGARMSWIQMADAPDGLAVNFNDFQTAVIDGTCSNGAFVLTPVATGLDRDRTHNIKMVIDFRDGPGNDLVQVYVDGVLKHTGTTWEDYFPECQPGLGNGSRTVDSILFRTGGLVGTHDAPATAGKGFLIDNLSLSSAVSPTTISDTTAAIAELVPFTDLYLFTVHATLKAPDGPIANKTIEFKAGTTTVCTDTTDANGHATCDGLASAVEITLNGGYTASFAGDGSFGASSASAPLLLVAGTPIP